jgi:hypothetical protein
MKVYLTHALYVARKFFRRIDLRPLKRRLNGFVQDEKANSFLSRVNSSQYALEHAVFDLLPLCELSDAVDSKITSEIHRALEFVNSYMKVRSQLGVPARAAFSRRLEGYFNDLQGLAPVEHELNTAIYLLNDGFQLQPGEFLGGRFDWLAKKQGIEFEVECKFISKERGRKILTRPLCNLADAIVNVGITPQNTGPSLFRVSIEVKRELPQSIHEIDKVAEQIKAALRNNLVNGVYGDLSWSVDRSAIPKQFAFDRKKLVAWARKQTRQEISSQRFTSAILVADDRVWIIEASSLTPDNVMSSVEKMLLRSAKKQFTKNRPSILVVRFAGVDADGISEISSFDSENHSSLKVMANRILSKRDHIHTLTFPSIASYETAFVDNENLRTTLSQSGGQAYSFKNESCKFIDSRQINVFHTSTIRGT